MTMMMSNLPRDLVEEILTKVPLKSIIAVRLTCKTWNALSKTDSFSKIHLGNEEAKARALGESRMIVMMGYNLYLMSITVNEIPSTKSLGKLTFLNDSEQVRISQVFHSNGLLLCILKDDNTRVVVWNPYWGQTRWIKVRDSDGLDLSSRYALGYENKKNKSCCTYKIFLYRDGYYVRGNHFFWYDIYDFDSDLWTTHSVNAQWCLTYNHHSVSLKGNTYWLAMERFKNNSINHIVCFDFKSEKFGPLLRLPFRIEYGEDVTLYCVREEKLAVLFTSVNTFKDEIWITTKIEDKEILWSKFLRSVDTGQLSFISISNGSFFIDEEKKVGMVFDNDCLKILDIVMIFREDGYFRGLGLGEASERWCWPLVCSYVPSSVQIKQPESGKKVSVLSKHVETCAVEKQIKDRNVAGGKRDSLVSIAQSLIYVFHLLFFSLNKITLLLICFFLILCNMKNVC